MPPFVMLHPLADSHERRREHQAASPATEILALNTTPPDGPVMCDPLSNPLPNNTRTSSRPTRQRATSYYNSFLTHCATSTDPPPSYAAAANARPSLVRSFSEGSESLPGYSCTVESQCRVLLSLESVNPLSPVGEGEWREVYLVLRGTLLSFHRIKDGRPGKLLRTYTLQHAEVGLATDSQHTILVPQSRLASLIPSAARRRAWQKDPDLFRPVRQSLLRLRLETDQVLIADADEELIHSLVNSISAAIDISQALDERSVPRQCTVPRRRRRPRPQFNGDLTDPALIAEQERIMRQMYPGLTGVVEDPAPTGTPLVQEPPAAGMLPASAPQTPAREEEEIDFSMIREESSTGNAPRAEANDGMVRPYVTRQTTSNTIGSVFSDDMMYASPNTNFDGGGKWRPPHHRSVAQVQRYVKRCMPVLLADANRASDIIVMNGKRMKINWRMELLEEWELQPPAYKSHKFETAEGLARSDSQRSATGSATQAIQQSSSSVSASENDAITRVEQSMETLQLDKVVSMSTTGKSSSRTDSSKTRHLQSVGQDSHGVVFCF